MTSIRATHTAPAASATGANPETTGLPLPLVLLLATAAGLAVAAIYYAQPILGGLGDSIGASDRAVGFVPTLTQLGYALGILLLAPLGDRYNRRTIILAKAAVLCVALIVAGMAPNIGVLLAASLAIGLAATFAQDIVPAAAALAPEAHRGKVVGTVMTGLLLGILLSRVVSGFVAEHFGWRSVFLAAAVSIALVSVAAWRGLPNFKSTTQLGYGALLGSLLEKFRAYPAMRQAMLAQGFLSVGFSAFWSTLAVMLHGAPYHLGSAAAGMFGLAGAAGALAAPIAGRVSDRYGPGVVTRLAAGVAALSFAAMFFLPLLSTQWRIALIVVSAIGFDLGVQAVLVAHQTIVYGIEPAARSRLNALLFVGMFIGMASGAALGSVLFAAWGWPAVVALATGSSVVALIVRMRRA